ncbi:hypothetical protein HRbin30_01662 [bacterium HR30]|nr:hypothetical protein HRbin30_01662 [bacterium HR30]
MNKGAFTESPVESAVICRAVWGKLISCDLQVKDAERFVTKSL